MGARVRMRSEWIDHPAGKYIEIKDGHLVVMGNVEGMSSYMPIAVYRPETWHRAEMTEGETE